MSHMKLRKSTKYGLLAIFFLWVVLMEADATYPAAVGVIQGTVSIKSSIAPRPEGRRRVAAAPDDSGYGSEEDEAPPPLSRVEETQYVVLYLHDAKGQLKATPSVATMQQRNKEFLPHVLPVVKGSQVIF